MEPRIKTRFNDGILRQVADPFGADMTHMRALDGFENFVYEYEDDSGAYILRIAHSSRRPESLVQAETHWIDYLARSGASVARPVPSRNGRLVESAPDGHGERFVSTAFNKVYGRPPGKVGWTPELYATYGRLVGRLHALTRRYDPGEGRPRRPQGQDPIIMEVEANLPASEERVLEQYHAVLRYLEGLPKTEDSYGLVHRDVHAWNLLVDDNGTMALFDFDDCAYSWFMNDIAIVLFHMVVDAKNPVEMTREFMTPFLRGYREENRLDAAWLREVPHFLKLREIEMYAVIHRSFDVHAIDDPWCARYMDGRKQRIEADVPFVDFEFESLSDCL